MVIQVPMHDNPMGKRDDSYAYYNWNIHYFIILYSIDFAKAAKAE